MAKLNGGKHQKVVVDIVGTNYTPTTFHGGIALSEPDHNHPDNKKTNIASSATEITLGEDGALYIYCPRNQLPPARYQNELDTVQKAFKQAFPNTTIIVSGHDLKFTSITKKQVFKGKLDGSLGNDDDEDCPF